MEVAPVPDPSSPDRTDAADREPIDPDVDLRHAAAGRRGRGAATGIGREWPAPRGAFPVSTLAVNVLGCALIGILMVLITDVWSRQRLLRPFLGTGVLGGFTTFSTYAVDIQRLGAGAHLGTALLYLAVTPIGALLAVWATATATRRLVNWRIA
jgi:CrcB protein